MPPRVVTIGECMVELRHVDERTLSLAYAGDAANVAVQLARLGVDAAFVSVTGDDAYSDRLVAALAAEGVDTRGVPRRVGRTPGLYLVSVDPAGERSFTYHRSQSPARDLFAADLAGRHAAALTGATWIWVSAITLSLLEAAAHERLLAALDAARAAGARVAVDTNFRPSGWPDPALARARIGDLLAHADLALPTLDDERALFGDRDAEGCCARLHALGVGEVAVKLGADGALVSHAGGRARVPAVRVRRVVDTTGAGDAFDAGYLAARLRGAPPEEAAAAGNALAARAIGHPGAIGA